MASKKTNKDMKKLNLRVSNDPLLTIDPSTIPITIPKEAQEEWIQEDPYFKIQEIEYPVLANGYNYTESFFKSFIKVLKDRPIPGSRDGHDTGWGARGVTDLLVVGGKIQSNKDGTGKAYLKNYILPVGGSGDNTVFIKENKTNMVEYSLVSYTEDEPIYDDAGNYLRTDVIKSLGHERNDAVGFGEGAMDQKTNTQQGKENIGEKRMDKKDILAALLVLKTNNGTDLPEIAKTLGLESLLITEQQKTNLAKHNSIVKLCGDTDPVEFIEGFMKERKENAASVRSALIDKEFGPAEFADTKKANSARVYAEKILGTAELTEEKLNEIKEDAIYKKLAAERQDITSDANLLGMGEKDKKNTTETEVVDY